MQRADRGKFKGMILADPPGLGKTLSALLAIASVPKADRMPSIIVAPPSCRYQWVKEITRYFEPHHLKPLLFTGDERMSPFEIQKYDVIVVSYYTIQAEWLRLNRFLQDMAAYKDGEIMVLPERPTVTLLSGVFRMENGPRLARYLILDEAHFFKNPDASRYESVAYLRDSVETCIMLTATPLDNTWHDCYALLSLLKGHPIASMGHMMAGFTRANRPRSVPTGKHFDRLVQMLDAVTLRRPASIISSRLPKLHLKTVEVKLDQADIEISNIHFKRYLKSVRKNRETGSRRELEVNWSALAKAQQQAYHPMLSEILFLETKAQKKAADGDPMADKLMNKKDLQKLSEWRDKLGRDGNWRSPRVMAIIDTIDTHRDMRKVPDDAFLIMDESVYFLDIVEIAVRNMHESLPVFRYDGRASISERDIVLERFFAATGPRALLASRGTGIQGLNMQCANVLIQCSPWWKASSEEQARGRIHRHGQKKPCFVYNLEAGCLVDKHKAKMRDLKNDINSRIMDEITRKDDAPTPARRVIE